MKKFSGCISFLALFLSSCATSSHLQRNLAGDGGDPVLSAMGTIGRQDGVTHGPVRNQMSGEICWSYTLADMAEDSYIKAHDSYKHQAHPAPEYLLFWHLYSQVKNNLPAFAGDANAIQAFQNGTADAKTATRAQHALDAYPTDPSKDPKTKVRNPLFSPNVGNVAYLALQEVQQFGMMPDDFFKNQAGQDLAFTTDEQEQKFEAMIPHFIGQVILKNHANYKGPKSEVNMALYKDLMAEFGDIFGLTARGIQMPLPTAQFTLDGQTYTPLTYMKNYLGYDPNDYSAYSVGKKPEDQQLALNAMAYTIRQNIPAPIGIEIFQDKDPSDTADGDNNDAFTRSQNTGLFTTDYCPMNHTAGVRQCNDDGGGHEVLGVNYFYTGSSDSPNVTGLIIQNSWGRVPGSRTVNGLISNQAAHSGYYIITADYLSQDSNNTTGGWDFVIPAKIGALPQFKNLVSENPKAIAKQNAERLKKSK